ncbi:MAG: hypothetical protein ABI602_00245 [Candidatus Saccharibacteria bacterium]
MKKLLFLSTGVASLAAAGLMLAPGLALAQAGNTNGGGSGSGSGGGYGYQQSLTTRAEAIGMTTDQLSAQLKSSTLLQIAKDKGLSEDQLHEKMQAAAQERWNANGLSQAEIDSRLKTMEARQANCDGTGNSGGGNGMHRNHDNQ